MKGGWWESSSLELCTSTIINWHLRLKKQKPISAKLMTSKVYKRELLGDDSPPGREPKNSTGARLSFKNLSRENDNKWQCSTLAQTQNISWLKKQDKIWSGTGWKRARANREKKKTCRMGTANAKNVSRMMDYIAKKSDRPCNSVLISDGIQWGGMVIRLSLYLTSRRLKVSFVWYSIYTDFLLFCKKIQMCRWKHKNSKRWHLMVNNWLDGECFKYSLSIEWCNVVSSSLTFHKTYYKNSERYIFMMITL